MARRVRLHADEPLATPELLSELTPGAGGWTVVADAWLFKEGEAERWSRAELAKL